MYLKSSFSVQFLLPKLNSFVFFYLLRQCAVDWKTISEKANRNVCDNSFIGFEIEGEDFITIGFEDSN